MAPGAGGLPQVSVIIPAHNGEAYLNSAIESALAQDGVDIEVILVDDGSTDGTAEIARAHPEVRYLPMERRGGNAYVTTNVGIAAARGRYVAVLHQDDRWRPGKLARQMALMDADPRMAMSYTAYQLVGPADDVLSTVRSPLGRGDHAVDGAVELRHLCIQNYISVCTAMLRRDLLEAGDTFPEDLWFSSEWALWTRLAMRSRIGYIDDGLSCIRIHGGSQTQSRTHSTAEFREQLLAVVDELFARPDLPPEVSARWHLALANVELSTVLQCLYWSDRRGALTAMGRLLRLVRPWEVPALIRSSAVVPRALARARVARRGRRDHAPGVASKV